MLVSALVIGANAARMPMPANTLLLAQLDAKQVVGGSASAATGTGAFLLDPARHSLSYNLTYQGLQNGPPKSIALYNFGRGGNGKMLAALCGAGTQQCPASASATISGRVENAERTLDNAMIGEFDSERVYVEISGGNGEPEIRGQLGANAAMVRFSDYTARLAAANGTASSSGTAVVTEVHLPRKTTVFYALTVARTTSAPTGAVLVARETNRVLKTLPVNTKSSRLAANGGTLTGSFSTDVRARQVLRNATLVVITRQFPKGELAGALMPVP
jgi:hypothetical protein